MKQATVLCVLFAISSTGLSGNDTPPPQPWLGVHVLMPSKVATEELTSAVEGLAKLGVNTIIAEINYGYEFESHPELSGENASGKADIRKLVAECRKRKVRLIPQFQCLGHQSWSGTTFSLLTKHPEFDETPGKYPQNKGIYCRSWCPLHPAVNAIIFDLMDELLKAFEADAMHVGMDEVFLIGDDDCPRCKGKDKAELFARAVNDYHGHLVGKRKVEMLMWGDRLIDFETIRYGEWEASKNGTAGAIDRIPKDIIICDWHYEPRAAYESVPMFTEKGFRVWPASWKNPKSAQALIDYSKTVASPKMLGHLNTTWGSVQFKDLARFEPLLYSVRSFQTGPQDGPIKQHPDNPHYFSFGGKPTILITSAEHYGAVVNRDFDYVAYFDALRVYGMNYTRIYPGFLFEPRDKFIKGNTLSPRPESLVLPWARSDQPGFRLGGNRFDLDRWNPEFFVRLKDFLAQADQRGIVVEICFFNCQYEDTWPLSPLSIGNNIQGVGDCHFNDAQTLRHPDLVKAETAYVRKIVEEANPFDNVILEICDEPILLGTPVNEAGAWIRHMADAVVTTEARLPKKHLLAQQLEGEPGGPCDLAADPRITVITAQYVWESMSQQVGGLLALDTKYPCDKPIELNETNYYPLWYAGDKVAASRVEAWEFIVGGGAGFNQLNGCFTVDNPAGKTADNMQVLAALRNLKEFMHGFDFLRMKPDKTVLKGGVPEGAIWRCLSEPGKQYALYLHHSRLKDGSSYQVTPGSYEPKLSFHLPAGTYRFDWMDPATGKILRTETLTHAGGEQTVAAPPYTVDFALGIRDTEK